MKMNGKGDILIGQEQKSKTKNKTTKHQIFGILPGIFLNTNPDYALAMGWLVKIPVVFEIESPDKTEVEKDFLKQNNAKNRKKRHLGRG